MSDLAPAHRTRPRQPLASGCSCCIRAVRVALRSLVLICLLVSGVALGQPTSASAAGGGQDPAAAVAPARALMERNEMAQAEEALGVELVDEQPWQYRPQLLANSPAGELPVLEYANGLTLCGTYAISEYIAGMT